MNMVFLLIARNVCSRAAVAAAFDITFNKYELLLKFAIKISFSRGGYSFSYLFYRQKRFVGLGKQHSGGDHSRRFRVEVLAERQPESGSGELACRSRLASEAVYYPRLRGAQLLVYAQQPVESLHAMYDV